jgi:hypothetical protein
VPWSQADGLSLLKQRFEAEQNTIELNFNNPNTDEEDIKIAIDQRETIGTLKKRIGNAHTTTCLSYQRSLTRAKP